MIKFEGFELSNSEDSIINRQPSTQPHILKQFMSALGATKGSSSWEKKSLQTDEQKDWFTEAGEGYRDLKYQGPGEYKSGKKADDLEGFKRSSFDSLKTLGDDARLSLEGLNKLRTYGATAATQVNPDIQALRGLGDKAWSGFDHQLAETTRGAREKLQQQDIAARRGGPAGAPVGGTALARLGRENVMEYGKTVGSAAARAVEQSAFQKQQLAMQARMQAGQLGIQGLQLGLGGLQTAQQGEISQMGILQGDLAQRRQLAEQSKQFGAGHELDIARYGEQQAQSQNLFNQTRAAGQNQFALSRLQGLGNLATARTFENIKNVKKGSAGLGGALLGAAGTIGGAYLGGLAGNPALGAQLGGSLAGSMVGQLGYGDDGTGSMMGQMAGQAYASSMGSGPQGIQTRENYLASKRQGPPSWQDPKNYQMIDPNIQAGYQQQGNVPWYQVGGYQGGMHVPGAYTNAGQDRGYLAQNYGYGSSYLNRPVTGGYDSTEGYYSNF